jgi:hypothetical protein
MFVAGHLGDRTDLRMFLSGGMVLSGLLTTLFGMVRGGLGRQAALGCGGAEPRLCPAASRAMTIANGSGASSSGCGSGGDRGSGRRTKALA